MLGSEVGAPNDSYDAFINANRIHKGLIATQCPMENTVSDVQRMMIEQNISMWIQLSPNIEVGDTLPNESVQCKMTPTMFRSIAQEKKYTDTNRSIELNNYTALGSDVYGLSSDGFEVESYNVQILSPQGEIRAQHVTSVWYKRWGDFEIPDPQDTKVYYPHRMNVLFISKTMY